MGQFTLFLGRQVVQVAFHNSPVVRLGSCRSVMTLPAFYGRVHHSSDNDYSDSPHSRAGGNPSAGKAGDRQMDPGSGPG